MEDSNSIIGFLYLLNYVLISVCLFIIAHKSGHPWKWLALVPVVNLWLMCDMADVPLYYIFLFLLPYGNLILTAWLWMRISEYTNKPQWLGLLMIVPLVNVAVALYMAFYEPPIIS